VIVGIRFGFGYWRRWIAERRARLALRGLLDILDGKSIAIVGNAASLLSDQYGFLIDEHDIVVRMNRGFPVDAASQGTRFDLWCFSGFRAALNPPKGFVPPRSVWMSHRRMKKGRVGHDCIFYPRSYWRALRDRLGARPSIGALAVDLIARATPREVTVIGFDFKRTGTFYQDVNHIGPHDFAAEERYIMEVVQERSWRFVAT
jgi:hypothetical protein